MYLVNLPWHSLTLLRSGRQGCRAGVLRWSDVQGRRKIGYGGFMSMFRSRVADWGKTTCLQNLKEVLELSGSSLEQVVKYNGGSESNIGGISC